MRAQLNLGLSHKLLVAATHAYLTNEPPMDWATLAETAAVTASPAAINRALSRLANDGLIDGLCTPAGWYQVRPSARGRARAAGAARRLALVGAPTEPEPGEPSRINVLTERASASLVQLQGELRTISTATATAWQHSARTLSPRIVALRTTMAETWRMFTSFP